MIFKKRKTKKLLSFAVSLLMAMGIISTNVHAQDAVTWDNLQNRIDNASSGEIIDLTSLETSTANKTLIISKDITLKGSATGESNFSTHKIQNLQMVIENNATVTLQDIALTNTKFNTSVISGTGNVRVNDSVIEQSTANGVTTEYAPVPTINLDGDVFVSGDVNEVSGNTMFSTSISGVTILDRDGSPKGNAGTAIRAHNVSVNGGKILGGSSFESSCKSGDGIIASGNISIKGTRKTLTEGMLSSAHIRSGSTIPKTATAVGSPIRFTDDASGTQRTLIIKESDVLGNDGATHQSFIYMNENDIAIVDSSKIGWYTDIPIFSNGGYSITNPVATWGILDSSKEVFKIEATNASLDKTRQVVDGTTIYDYAYNGDLISIEASQPESGKTFDSWSSAEVTFENNTDSTTTFTMPASNVTIEATYKELPPPPSETPKITVGAGFTYQLAAGKDFTITCSGLLEDLTGIYVDGKLVDPNNYTLKSGSTILTLKASYLDTLSVGKHTLKFAYKDDVSVQTDFTITAKAPETPKAEAIVNDSASPKTGDTSNILLFLSLIILSGCAVTFVLKRKRAIHR